MTDTEPDTAARLGKSLIAGLPQPEAMNNPGDFMAGLKALKVAAGNPSLRDLQRSTGLPRTTIADALDPRRSQLPPMDRVLALVRAFGVPESGLQEWAHAWTYIQLTASTGTAPSDILDAAGETGGKPDDGPDSSVKEAAFGPEETLASEDERRDERPNKHPARRTLLRFKGRQLWSHGITLVVGTLIGATTATLMQSDPRPVKAAPVPITDNPGCPTPAAAPKSANAPSAAPVDRAAAVPNSGKPAWVSRPASDQQILLLSGVDLPVQSVVHSGDALIVTLMLTNACPGAVTVTDTRGNHYRTVGDLTDSSHHRTMILASFGINPLTTADTIHVVYPQSSKYHVAVDEFSGISSVVRHTGAFGNSGGVAFTTSTNPIMCAPGELMVAAVGTNTGTQPAFADGWTTLPVLKLSSYRLTTAYEVASTADKCAATGTTTSQWGAVLATFR